MSILQNASIYLATHTKYKLMQSQIGNVQFCDCTIWQLAILWLHNCARLTPVANCDCTKGHCATLCNAHLATCHFVIAQLCKYIIFVEPIHNYKEGVTLANFFRHLFWTWSFKTEQTWIFTIGHLEKQNNSHHFFNMLDHHCLASI